MNLIDQSKLTTVATQINWLTPLVVDNKKTVKQIVLDALTNQVIALNQQLDGLNYDLLVEAPKIHLLGKGSGYVLRVFTSVSNLKNIDLPIVFEVEYTYNETYDYLEYQIKGRPTTGYKLKLAGDKLLEDLVKELKVEVVSTYNEFTFNRYLRHIKPDDTPYTVQFNRVDDVTLTLFDALGEKDIAWAVRKDFFVDLPDLLDDCVGDRPLAGYLIELLYPWIDVIAYVRRCTHEFYVEYLAINYTPQIFMNFRTLVMKSAKELNMHHSHRSRLIYTLDAFDMSVYQVEYIEDDLSRAKERRYVETLRLDVRTYEVVALTNPKSYRVLTERGTRGLREES